MLRSITAAVLTAIALSLLGPPAVAAAQPPGTDVAACLDGNCTLRVTGPVEIPLDGRAGPTGLSVSADPSAVVFRMPPSTGTGQVVLGRGSTMRFGTERGTLAIRVLEVGPGGAVIELSTQPA